MDGRGKGVTSMKKWLLEGDDDVGQGKVINKAHWDKKDEIKKRRRQGMIVIY